MIESRNPAGDESPDFLVVPEHLAPMLPSPKEPPPQPVPAKDSATVVLVRDVEDGSGVEVFLQRRVRSMAFAAGMTVFPGGGVDQRDADASIGWVGPRPRNGPGGSPAPSRWHGPWCAPWSGRRSEVRRSAGGYGVQRRRRYRCLRRCARGAPSGELSLASFLAESGLVLRADLLRPWANWVTPEEEPRRYDARFFVAALPEGQVADGATTEVESAHWQRPEDAIADAEAGRVGLMPPTWCTLSEISRFSSVAEVLACERRIRRIMPRFVQDGERIVVKLS